MAIQSNASTESVQGGGIKLYSGISNFQVVAVNPTLVELHEMGIMFKTEPNYEVSFNDVDYNKLVFWVKNEDLTTRVEILVSPKERVSKSGKYQWINSIGQSTWADENGPTYDWWKTEGQRKAYIGEETLINFVKTWANVANGDEVSFEQVAHIVSGDVKELRSLITSLTNNQVRLLVGVKNDRYQTVYNKYFGRIKPERTDMFIKMLKDDYGAFDSDFNADLKWGEHVPTASLVSPDALNEDDDWTMPDKPMSERQKVEEESPF